MKVAEAMYLHGYQFVREVELDEVIQVFSAVITKSGLLANCGDYVSYFDQYDEKVRVYQSNSS